MSALRAGLGTRRATEERMDAKTLPALAGDEKQIVEELRAFNETAKLLSQPEVWEQYKGEWVALYDRRVRAHSKTFDHVLQEVDKQGLPRRNVLIRFIDDGTVNLILNALG